MNGSVKITSLYRFKEDFTVVKRSLPVGEDCKAYFPADGKGAFMTADGVILAARIGLALAELISNDPAKATEKLASMRQMIAAKDADALIEMTRNRVVTTFSIPVGDNG